MCFENINIRNEYVVLSNINTVAGHNLKMVYFDIINIDSLIGVCLFTTEHSKRPLNFKENSNVSQNKSIKLCNIIPISHVFSYFYVHF